MQGQRKSISHTMELPRQIVVGENNIEEVGKFLHGLCPNSKKVSIISGKNVKKIFGQQIDSSLKESKINSIWHLATSNLVKDTKQIQKKVKNAKTDLIIGIGGGRSVDIAKLCSFNLRKPFVSIPTSASHDGIASPFVSVRGEKPHSLVATAPLGVFVDVNVIKGAPKKLLASGCGDLMAKVTAVKDWQLGRDKKGEYYGRYSADLASMSAKILIMMDIVIIMT